jgi:4-amino-4-deoxy-L-arabinose transferase-like glycosyltransferase
VGETTFGIRLVPVLAFVVSGYLVGDIARCLSNGAEGLPVLAAALFNLSMLVFALGSFATPDAPSTLFWVAALWAVSRAINIPPATRAASLWWVGAGLLIGLGGVSKFTNAFLGFGLLAYLIVTVKGRTFLFTRLPCLAVFAVILPMLPYLFWNVQNDWLGLERQGARLAASGFSPQYLGEYAALLLLAPTPLVTWFAFRAFKDPPKDSALLVWSSLPLLLYFTYHATHSAIQANWIVPLQALFAIMAAFGLYQSQSPSFWVKVTFSTSFLISVGFVTIVFNLSTPIGTADNPPNQTRGWSSPQIVIAKTVDDTGATWIATTDYARTGSLALRFPKLPVWSMVELQRYDFRGAFPTKLCTAPGLLIERARGSETESKTARALFETVGTARTVVRSQNGVTLMRYHLTPVSGVKSRELCPA